MALGSARSKRVRAVVVLAVMLVGLGLLVTRCPANRDGMPGQLARAMEQTAAAARSGALALDLWLQDRSTSQLITVQLSDARDEVADAYQGIADLRADDPVDVGRQRLLTGSMNAIIGQLNAASAAVRGLPGQPAPRRARADLLASADALEAGYR